MEEEIKLGYYHHFKGRFYKVEGLATHSETLEEMVVYRQLGNDRLWVRPAKMWNEKVVNSDGETVLRFEFVGNYI